MVYLANDLIQRSKISGHTGFHAKFQPILPSVFDRLMTKINAIDESSIKKVIDVWRNRKVYPKEFLDSLKTISVSDEPHPVEPIKLKDFGLASKALP